MKRRLGLIVIGVLMLVFIVLSGFSFIGSRGQVLPQRVTFGPYGAVAGKRVFQAYSCMDCHTIVGNGAYFAPDLTKEFARVGPAWLAAFLPSAGSWPTEGALRVQLMNDTIAAEAGTDTIEAYYKKYPGAKSRVERRGSQQSYMPNLRFSSDEVGKLIAFLKYTSMINTEGWPPKIETGSLKQRILLLYGNDTARVSATAATQSSTNAGGGSLAEPAAATSALHGANLVKTAGCLACHSTGHKRVIGPPWAGLFGSPVKLSDGRTVTADEAYLTESIVQPNIKTVDGYPMGAMPSYKQLLSKDDVQAIVTYIRSLENK